MSLWAMIDGRLTDKPSVDLEDRGYTLGDGLFETIPLYAGKPFGLERHLERLRAGADRIHLQTPFDNATVKSSLSVLADKNSVDRGVARLTVTRGCGPRGYGIEGCDRPSWTLTLRPYEPVSERMFNAGFRLARVSIDKNPSSPLSGLKTTSSLETVLILAEARKKGADEALALTTEGHVASGAAVNLFWLKDDKLFTPSCECGILQGVTRGVALDMARDEKIETVQGRFYPGSVSRASEVFVTNSLLEIVPVNCVDGLLNISRPGPVTSLLKDKYRRLTISGLD